VPRRRKTEVLEMMGRSDQRRIRKNKQRDFILKSFGSIPLYVVIPFGRNNY
jgi:hypothetical protein